MKLGNTVMTGASNFGKERMSPVIACEGCKSLKVCQVLKARPLSNCLDLLGIRFYPFPGDNSAKEFHSSLKGRSLAGFVFEVCLEQSVKDLLETLQMLFKCTRENE